MFYLYFMSYRKMMGLIKYSPKYKPVIGTEF